MQDFAFLSSHSIILVSAPCSFLLRSFLISILSSVVVTMLPNFMSAANLIGTPCTMSSESQVTMPTRSAPRTELYGRPLETFPLTEKLINILWLWLLIQLWLHFLSSDPILISPSHPQGHQVKHLSNAMKKSRCIGSISLPWTAAWTSSIAADMHGQDIYLVRGWERKISVLMMRKIGIHCGQYREAHLNWGVSA